MTRINILHFSDTPILDDININDNIYISASDGYTWLGFTLSHSKDICSLVEFNLNKRKFNIAKFYSWLQSTPFPLKM